MLSSWFVSRILPKNPKIRKLKTAPVVLTVNAVLCGNEEWCVIPGEDHWFTVSKDEVLRRIDF
jgi:hypothetical protein